MTQPATHTSNVKRMRRWSRALWLIPLAGLAGWVLWAANLTLVNRDPLFRGQPESAWIQALKYSDDAQVKAWRAYGEAGVQVLIRGLQNANRPGERAYRRVSRWVPNWLGRWLPPPKPDSTRSTRMCLVSLLSSLGKEAQSAKAVMMRTVIADEADDVREIAICYFTSSEDRHCLLNQLSAKEKQTLLPALIRAIQHPGNWGLRNNATIALRFYPEHREVVAPVLVKALQDPQLPVRLLAAEALNRVDPEAARRAGASSIIVAIAKNPDDQLAARAVAALRNSGVQPEVAVPALVEALQSTNSLIACEAVWALQWSHKEFAAYAATIVPALTTAAQRTNNVGRYAKAALANWQPKPTPLR